MRVARRAVAGVVKPEDEPRRREADEDGAEATNEADHEDGVVDSEEIVKTEAPEGAEALERR